MQFQLNQRYKGLFGPIEVIEDDARRYLLLSGQIQGGSFKEPSASSAERGMVGPGPIAGSSYMAGWLLAGAMHPVSSMVCVGLGSGAGIIQLLQQFPDVDLTVIEIDPVMAEVAKAGFPLLQQYELEGRLNIVIQDAKDYLIDADVFDVGLADAYDGASYKIKDSYMSLLFQKSRSVYANVIDPLDGTPTRQLLKLAQTMGKLIQFRLHASFEQNIASSQYEPANWIMTTDDLDPAILDQYQPFEDLPASTAKDYANSAYQHLITQVA